MRGKLQKDLESRKKFHATFAKLGKKAGFNGQSQETILLKEVIDVESGKQVTGHVWLNYTKGFEALNLREGMQVEFQARVVAYTKGYVYKGKALTPRKKDYKLSHPTQIKALKKE